MSHFDRPYSGIYVRTPATERGYERRGRFAGLGLKGYRRSDERMKEEVCDHLAADADIDAGALTGTVKDGEVALDEAGQRSGASEASH